MLQFFAKVISEDIWGSPAKNVWGWKPPKPPKTAKSLKTTKKGSEHASLDILKALILIIFSHFFQVGAVHTTPKNHFFVKRFFPWIFSLNHLSNEPKWLVRLTNFKNSWYLEQSVVSLISKYILVAESYYCNCCDCEFKYKVLLFRGSIQNVFCGFCLISKKKIFF